MTSDVDEAAAGLAPGWDDGCGEGDGELVPFVLAPAVEVAVGPAVRPALEVEVEFLGVVLLGVEVVVVVLLPVPVPVPDWDWLLDLRVEPTNLRNRLFMDDMSLPHHHSGAANQSRSDGAWRAG